MSKTVKVWARVGAYVEVDAVKFVQDPEQALKDGVKAGKMTPSGETYIPDRTVRDELKYRGVVLTDYNNISEIIENDEELSIEI